MCIQGCDVFTCCVSLSQVVFLKLEREKAEHAAELSGLEKQIAQLKDQLNKARHGLQDQLASARAPLQAKIEDMEDAMQHLQDKFNKVKAENDRVSLLV